ncbi:F-box protein CPR1 [Linum perenne]
MVNILLRLRVKDLVSCRRVSKQWLSIIDDPHFISRQLQRSISTNSNAALFLQDKRRVGERLVAYGFGYDESSDDYKVVRILQTRAEDDSYRTCYHAEIFSVRSKGFFRKIPLPTANWLDYARKFMGVFVGGSIHWCINTNSVVIHAIDLVSNTYHHFQGPDYKFCQTVLDNMNVGIVDTHLSVCGALKEQSKIGIWVMEEHGNPESWNMLYCIDHQWSLPYSLTPVGSNSDKILLMLDWNRFVWYDPINVADGTILADNLKWRYGSYEPIYCLESLVKIFPDKGADVKKDAYGKQLKRIAVSAQEIPQSSHPDFLELRSLNALMFEDYSEPCSAEEEFYAEIFNLRF